MEYIYAAMLLHKAGKKVNEDSVKKILAAAGMKPDEARIKALVAALEGIDIDNAIKSAAIAPVASAGTAAHKHEDKKEEHQPKKQEEKKSEEEAAAGLGALFG
ncbi:50S ribosomal protein P1 [Candidatus Woesearchaeota archaeon]|nr:50S ribosomal protein P1 [Candidatus Woesearchaeota archaeon]